MVEATQTILPQPSRVIAVLAKQAAIGSEAVPQGQPRHRPHPDHPSRRKMMIENNPSIAQPSPAIRAA